MIDHLSIALMGILPGEPNHLSIATMGLFTTTVTIEPVVQSGGGGYVPVQRGQKPDRYIVTVTVVCGDKKYEEKVMVDDLQAKVTARVNGITEFSEDQVMISVNGVQVNKSNPVFTITK